MFFRDLETERLYLKNIARDDRDFLLRQFSDPAVNRYLYDAEPLASLAEADELLDFYLQSEPRAQHRWILVRKSDGAKIGTCGYHCWDERARRAEIGYDLQPAFWRQGLMSEALSAILPFAKEEMGLCRLDAEIAVENAASRGLAEKCGFAYEGENAILRFRDRDYLHHIYTLRFKL